MVTRNLSSGVQYYHVGLPIPIALFACTACARRVHGADDSHASVDFAHRGITSQ